MRRIVCAAALLAAAPSAAHAFSYKEHCETSNLALRVAVARERALRRAPARPVVAFNIRATDAASWSVVLDSLDAFAKRPCLEKGDAFGFGDLVARVDVANNPADFWVGYPNSKAFEQLRTTGIPWPQLNRMWSRPFNRFRAMHQNEEHFADRALLSFDLWHRLGLDFAAHGTLDAALVISAFADHYLEDIHAAGHVRTPRRRLNDEIAFGMHNYYNRRGAPYQLRRASIPALVDSTSEMAVTGALDAVVADLCTNVPLISCLAQLSGRDVPFYGDNQLAWSPGQRLLLTLFVARQMSDVLDAAVSCDAAQSNRFTTLAYGYPTMLADARHLGALRGPGLWMHASANTGFGDFRPDTTRGWTKPDGAVTFGAAVQTFPNAGNPSADERMRLGVEMLAFGHPGRFQVDTQDVRQGLPGQWLLAIGLDAVGDPGGQPTWTMFQGIGPTGRLTFAFPAVDIQLAAYGGVRAFAHTRGSGRNDLGSHGALRLTTDFAFLQLGIETGWDSYIDLDSRRLKRARVLSTSLNLTTSKAVKRGN